MHLHLDVLRKLEGGRCFRGGSSTGAGIHGKLETTSARKRLGLVFNLYLFIDTHNIKGLRLI